MKRIIKTRVDILMVALMIGWLSAIPIAAACSVCFGDKDDPMVKGTANGVLVMIGVTYAMLLGMGAFVATWFVRARRTRPGGSGEAVPTAGQDCSTRNID